MERISELLDGPARHRRARRTRRRCPSRRAARSRCENVTFAYPGRPDLPALQRLHPAACGRASGWRWSGPRAPARARSSACCCASTTRSPAGCWWTASTCATPIRREVRARMALVAQDAPLFSGSAAENIRFGREDASDAEVVQAAVRAAQAEGFLAALPQGFDTPVGERGPQPVRRPAPAPGDRPRPGPRRPDPAARRGHQRARRRERAAGAAGAGRGHGRPHHPGHRPPPGHRAEGRPHRGHGRGPRRRGGHATTSWWRADGLYARLAALQFGEAA